MFKNKVHITALFAVLITVGLFSTMNHYHNEGLECLEHAQEAHFVQNEVICPVSSLVVSFDFDSNLCFDGFIQPEDVLFDSFKVDISEIHTHSVFGRAPPFLA